MSTPRWRRSRPCAPFSVWTGHPRVESAASLPASHGDARRRPGMSDTGSVRVLQLNRHRRERQASCNVPSFNSVKFERQSMREIVSAANSGMSRNLFDHLTRTHRASVNHGAPKVHVIRHVVGYLLIPPHLVHAPWTIR